jgi:uncharacterized protein
LTRAAALLVALGAGVVALAAPSSARADDALPPPPGRHVLDEAGWLSPDEERRLDSMLSDYEAKTSNQFVVAIFRTLGGEDLADRSQRIAEHWGIGQAAKDNGVLLAVYADERAMSLEVGYGLEPVITDLVATRVRRDILEPAFREGRYYEGIRSGMQALAEAAAGEFRAPRRDPGARPDLDVRVILALLVIALILGSVLRRVRGAPLVLGPGGSRRVPRVRGGWMLGRPSGGGGFRIGGGSGGGGFRGGGGSFGGGGSRGSW